MLPSKRFEKKRILVGISGCIAAYKSCELIRQLIGQGAEVRVMMTRSAEKFITPLTLETLSNHPVYTKMFPRDQYVTTHHISAADWAEAVIMAPATANVLGKAANGIADDFVSTALLAASCPVVYAPAMNTHMWNSDAVQRNVKTLRGDGAFICEPEEGFLAEGYNGVGRLARTEYLQQSLYRALHPYPHSLAGKTVLITAGCTQEYLDPVRMLTNRSSGKMGFALAWEAYARGAKVILVHGPGRLTPPMGMEVCSVVSAEEMYKVVKMKFAQSDIFVSAAAIADYRPSSYSSHKIKKGDKALTLELEKTIDVLSDMSENRKDNQRAVGFAVETESAVANARRKMESKNLDMIVLNNPLEEGAAFGVETNKVTLLRGEESREIDLMYKLDVAYEVFDFLAG